MRQRVVIAIAMANNPDVIIADEPTTALDVTVQAQVLEALEAARAETGAALVLITHDLGVIAGHADRVCVMYAGKLVETGTVDDVFYAPADAVHAGLLGSLPRVDEGRGERLTPIVGLAAVAAEPAARLPVHAALPARPARLRRGRARPAADRPRRTHWPPATSASSSSGSRGRRRVRGDVGRRRAPTRSRWPTRHGRRHDRGRRDADRRPTPAATPVVSVRNLVKHFPVRSAGHPPAADRRRARGLRHLLRPRRRTRPSVWSASPAAARPPPAALLLNLIRATSGEVRYGGQGPDQAVAPRRCGRCAATCRSCSRTRSRRWTRG